MIDQKVPQSLVYLRNVMKRARKYEAALAIISHSIVVLLSESIKQYGQALMYVPCYKILTGTDRKNLKETAELYDLTEAEQKLLLARKRGHALFMAGAITVSWMNAGRILCTAVPAPSGRSDADRLQWRL